MDKPLALRRQVGENIRSLRKTKGWSQEFLGERAGLSYKFVGEVERGAVNPSLDSLHGIAEALQVEVAELFLNNDLMLLSGEDVADARTAVAMLGKVLDATRLEHRS